MTDEYLQAEGFCLFLALTCAMLAQLEITLHPSARTHNLHRPRIPEQI